MKIMTFHFFRLEEKGMKAVLDCSIRKGLIGEEYKCPWCDKGMVLKENKGLIDGFIL